MGVTHIFPRVKRVSISISVASRKQPLNGMAEKGGWWCLNGPVWMVEQGCLSGPAWMVEQGRLGVGLPGRPTGDCIPRMLLSSFWWADIAWR